MKDLSSSRSGAKKNGNPAPAKELGAKDKRMLPPEAAYLLVDLKDSMTLLYFTLENLRGCVHDRRAYENTIENMQDLTRRIDGLMKKFLEAFPKPS